MSAGPKPKQKKAQLLELIDAVGRGTTATPEDQAKIDEAAKQLEALNPTKNPVTSPLLNGQWRLLYTSSSSILRSKSPALFKPSGPIYQILDIESLKARNRETAPLFNEVIAELEPESGTRVNVTFKMFKVLGFIPVPIPENRLQQWLDTTYLDDDLRIGRGNKGNLFVLSMDDRDAKP